MIARVVVLLARRIRRNRVLHRTPPPTYRRLRAGSFELLRSVRYCFLPVVYLSFSWPTPNSWENKARRRRRRRKKKNRSFSAADIFFTRIIAGRPVPDPKSDLTRSSFPVHSLSQASTETAEKRTYPFILHDDLKERHTRIHTRARTNFRYFYKKTSDKRPKKKKKKTKGHGQKLRFLLQTDDHAKKKVYSRGRQQEVARPLLRALNRRLLYICCRANLIFAPFLSVCLRSF